MSRTSDGEIQPVMRGTDGAALASVCTEPRLAELDPANVPADVDTIKSAATEARLAELDAANLPSDTDDILTEVVEIETHLHSYEHWFETASAPNGEVHVVDHVGDGAGVLQIDAGNNAWSAAWVQILGSSDTPHTVGKVKFDLHMFLFTAAQRNEIYFVQVAFGTSGAAALSAGNYTETAFMPVSNQIDSGPVIIQGKRQDVGTKVWIRVKCPGQVSGTLDFLFGLHEYDE